MSRPPNQPAAPSQAALHYFGGKWRIADRIVSHFPPHALYCEPYGGGAGVLLRKAPSIHEVYNDINGEVVNFFRVLRDPDAARELTRVLELTPYARREHLEAFEAPPSADPVESARRFFVKSRMSRCHAPVRNKLETFDNRLMGGGGVDMHRKPFLWRNAVVNLAAVAERFANVVVENKPALEAIELYDWPNALFYCDPPYLIATRNSSVGIYGDYEMNADDHAALAAALKEIQGKAVVSGYRCPLYDELYRGWRRVDIKTNCQTGKSRVESLWLSPGIEAPRRLF